MLEEVICSIPFQRQAVPLTLHLPVFAYQVLPVRSMRGYHHHHSECILSQMVLIRSILLSIVKLIREVLQNPVRRQPSRGLMPQILPFHL